MCEGDWILLKFCVYVHEIEINATVYIYVLMLCYMRVLGMMMLESSYVYVRTMINRNRMYPLI